MRARLPILSRTGLALAALLCIGGAAQAGPRTGRPRLPRPHLGRLRPFVSPSPPAGALQAQSDPTARALLRRMLVAGNNLALAGTQVTTVAGGATSEQYVLRDGARALRMDYTRPPQMRGEVIVDDGRTYYHYLPGQNRVETQPSQVRSLRVRVPQVITQIRSGELLVQRLGQDTVAGHACVVVGVTTRGGNPAERKFWIDPTNGAQLKIEQDDAAGQPLSVSYYTSVTYNPPLNAHSFAPPQGALAPGPNSSPQPTVPTPAQVGFTVLQPAFLPPGFHFQSAAVTKYQGKKVAALRYVNGLNVLSLFETPDNGRGPIKRYPRAGVLVARQGGLKIVLVSSLGRNKLEKVVNSLR